MVRITTLDGDGECERLFQKTLEIAIAVLIKCKDEKCGTLGLQCGKAVIRRTTLRRWPGGAWGGGRTGRLCLPLASSS